MVGVPLPYHSSIPPSHRMIASRSVKMARRPRGSYIVVPIASSGVVTPENKVWPIGAVIHKQGSMHKVPNSVLRARGSWKDAVHPSCDSPNSSRRFALGASNVFCLVKTRRAPSRHSRDARVLRSYDYGHAQTEYTSPPPTPFRLRLLARPPPLRPPLQG